MVYLILGLAKRNLETQNLKLTNFKDLIHLKNQNQKDPYQNQKRHSTINFKIIIQ